MIAFVDIDGVMHPVKSTIDRYFVHAGLLVDWLLEHPEVQLVVSSSWRETHRIEDIREMLLHFDPDLQGRVIGATPTIASGHGAGAERSAECLAWLSENGHDQAAWVAVDDDQDLFDKALRKSHLVLCDARTGLNRARLSLAWQKLRRQQREEPQRRRYRTANPPGVQPGIQEVGLDEEAEIIATIDRARQAEAEAASAAVAAAAARRDRWLALPHDQKWVTVFLDIDEVLCVGQPFAAASLHKAFADDQKPEAELLDALFSRAAREALLHVHDQLHGRLRYVLSSSWREHFTREQIQVVMRETGFDFLAETLHSGEAWRCYRAGVSTDRQQDIESWLEHFHAGEPFAVIDDKFSGGGLNFNKHFPGHQLHGRVTICSPGVGLTMDHVDEILVALRRPA